MRLIRILVAVAIILVVPVLTATAAGAELSGPCTAGGQVKVGGIPQTPDINPATTNSVKIPRKGNVQWHGTAGAGNRIVSGYVRIKLPPPLGDVKIGSWSTRTSSHANAGVYKYDFATVLLGLKAPVRGVHTESSGLSCSGSITVQLDGSPIKNPILVASLVLTFFAVLNFGLVLRAQVR